MHADYLHDFLRKPIPPSEEDEATILAIISWDGVQRSPRIVDPTIERSPSVDIASLIDVKSKDLTHEQLQKIMTNDIYPLAWKNLIITSNWENIEKLKQISRIIAPLDGTRIHDRYPKIESQIDRLTHNNAKGSD
jgi:hypothetical protein